MAACVRQCYFLSNKNPKIRCQPTLSNLYTEAEGNTLSWLSPLFYNYGFNTLIAH